MSLSVTSLILSGAIVFTKAYCPFATFNVRFKGILSCANCTSPFSSASNTPFVFKESAVDFFNDPESVRSTSLAGRISFPSDFNGSKWDFKVKSSGISPSSCNLPCEERLPNELSTANFCNCSWLSTVSACAIRLGISID